MKILITGVCGFVGEAVAAELQRRLEGLTIIGLDNLSRPGSEQNRAGLRRRGVRVFHGDIRNPSDLESLPAVDWVLDAAANPSVLAGVNGQTSSRQLIEHNLIGTVNVLEYCRRHGAGLIMLSTSRVYSLERLANLPVDVVANAFVPSATAAEPGLSPLGVTEAFSTATPVSLYGAAKLASEITALEYGVAFGFPVHVNRCGVLAGAGQFGKSDQGIFSFWIHAFREKRPLNYIGFDGRGYQVRDCLDPRDLAALVTMQVSRQPTGPSVINVSGGLDSALSLSQLTDWCTSRFGRHEIGSQPAPRRYDVPWLVLDSSRAAVEWQWKPVVPVLQILEDIASHAEQHPGWLDASADA